MSLNANHPQHIKPEGHPLWFSMLRAIRRDNYRQFIAAVKPLDIILHYISITSFPVSPDPAAAG